VSGSKETFYTYQGLPQGELRGVEGGGALENVTIIEDELHVKTYTTSI
jgi:hypothetical protein